MIKNHLRHFWKNKTSSLLNILGFGIGIACASLIFLWVEDELHFDDNNLKKDRIFLVRVNAKLDAGIFTHSSTPGPLAQALQSSMPAIAATCRTSEGLESRKFNIGNKAMYASGKWVEPTLFDMFTSICSRCPSWKEMRNPPSLRSMPGILFIANNAGFRCVKLRGNSFLRAEYEDDMNIV